MRKILLDTNAFTRLFGGDRSVFSELVAADTVYVSTIVLGELHAGLRGGRNVATNRRTLRSFLAKDTVRLLLVDAETSEIFGEVKQRLKAAGTPIPINDVWIAAHAMQTGSFLVTYDKHFQKVSGLLMWPEL